MRQFYLTIDPKPKHILPRVPEINVKSAQLRTNVSMGAVRGADQPQTCQFHANATEWLKGVGTLTGYHGAAAHETLFLKSDARQKKKFQ